jgi:hypothetical protein
MKRLADSRDDPASWAMSAWVILTSTSRRRRPRSAPGARARRAPRRRGSGRLEGLAGEALVGLAQAPAQRDDELDRDVGVLAQQRRMSEPGTAMACTSSSVSTVAERSSSSNIASSPKMSPGPKCASAIMRPSGCSRIARAWPERTT